jgi:ubiquinone/menaquinone biosynthesis C-methylase UbiE
MSGLGVIISPEEFLTGQLRDGGQVDDLLSMAALDLTSEWGREISRGERRIRCIQVNRAGLSVRITPNGGRSFVGVLAGRFALDGSGDGVVGPGEVLEVPDRGATLLLLTPRPQGRLTVLDCGPSAIAQTGGDLPIPTVHGGNADGMAADYYHGYADRYEEVYLHGATTWETTDPNDILVRMLQRLEVNPCRVIDLGCGEGRDAIFLARNGFKVLGVDVSHAALQRARERARQEGVECRFLERDVTTLRGVPDRSFDFAINMGCLHMMPDKDSRSRHLARVFEVLRPSGWFLLAHCREKWLHGFWSVPEAESIGTPTPGRIVERRLRTARGAKTVPLVLVPYLESTEDQLAAECEQVGFKVLKVLSQAAEAFGSTAVLLLGRPA